MLGQIIQLAALGVQDLYLKIKPQYTMFRKSYKRHTNYATQVVRVASNTTATWGSKVDFDLTRNGDLIAETYLVVQLPCITGGVYKEDKWWPTAYKAVPGYINADKDWWSHRGDHLVAHVGKRLEEDKSKARVKSVVGHVKNESTTWAGHPKTDGIDSATNGTTSETGVLVGPSHSQVGYVDALGHAIIKDARFFIAQNVIQEFTGEYMHIHHLMNNPGETLNEALFAYGDDMHAQGPQGGSLADGVGFQASKYGHGAIASGGYWIDMYETRTDPRQHVGALTGEGGEVYVNTTVAGGKDRLTEQERKDKKDFSKLDSAAVSQIGRSMAFLPLASQTYVGMCFHNASAANAHIDYADKGLDTRSAESPYVAGAAIGNDSATSKAFVAIKGAKGAEGYSNYDDWGTEFDVSTKIDSTMKGSSDTTKLVAALKAKAWFTSANPAENFEGIRAAFAKTTGVDGAFFIIPRGIRSRTQARGLGLHDFSGYHGSLVRVEDSVGSGLQVSDKFIGLDEFNASQSVPRVLANATQSTITEDDISLASRVFNKPGFVVPTTSMYEISSQDEDLFFNNRSSTQHHNPFTIRAWSTAGSDTNQQIESKVRIYDDADYLEFGKSVKAGDPIFMTTARDLPEIDPFTGRQLLGIDHACGNEVVAADGLPKNKDQEILCLKLPNTDGVTSHTGASTAMGATGFAAGNNIELAVAQCAFNKGMSCGLNTEFKAAYDTLRHAHITPGRIVRITARAIEDATGQFGDKNAATVTAENLALDLNGAANEYAPTASAVLTTALTMANAGFTAGHNTGTFTNRNGASFNTPTTHEGDLFVITKWTVNDTKQQCFVSLAKLDSFTRYYDASTPAATFSGNIHIDTSIRDTCQGTARLVLGQSSAGNANTKVTPIMFGIDFVPHDVRSIDPFTSQPIIAAHKPGERIFLGYAGHPPSRNVNTYNSKSASDTVLSNTSYYDLPLFMKKEDAVKSKDNPGFSSDTTKLVSSTVLAAKVPNGMYNPIFQKGSADNKFDAGAASIFIDRATGLSLSQQQSVAKEILKQAAASMSAMVTDMVRTEFHRGSKQSGSQYFDSESTAGCGPRASLGALMYTSACAQPIGSAPACSQLASDIIVPQYSNAVTDPKASSLTFGTRMMVALDRTSNLNKITGVKGAAYSKSLDDAQDKESARLVKNYNPGPAYEVVGSRLDTSMYSKLRTHAQMNSGFGRRAQISAVGNHQLEDGSGKCVQVVVPMPWWYAEGPACDGRRTQALPMIALQYHNVSISVNLRNFNECVQTDREHRQQPFRCSKMIGSLGKSALMDAKSDKVGEAAGDKAMSFASMPTHEHGAREGSTLIDTLGKNSNQFPQERAVTCVNMHSVKDTLSGLRWKGAAADYYKDLVDVADMDLGASGQHILAKNTQTKNAETAPGYQGHVDERHHVDVGTWLNFASQPSTYLNSHAEKYKRNTLRIGTYDGEHVDTTKGKDNDRNPFYSAFAAAADVGARATTTADFAGDAGGDASDWGQNKWDSTKMSDVTKETLKKIGKVPAAAVFGKGQLNGGFAIHSEAQAIGNKLALTGGATVCTMREAVQSNQDVCNIFYKAVGTQGWKTSGSLAGSKSELQLIGAHLLVTFIFLDSSERRLFASNAHEYLLCQIQKQEHHETAITASGTPHQISIDLKFNHPVSHLFWVLQRPESQWAREWFRYEATHGAGDPLMIRAELSLNSSKREEENYLNATNTTVIEPWNYFKKCNNTGIGGALKSHSFDGSAANIHTYSFAQNPGEWYPTGSLNFSRIDRVELKLFCKAHAEAHLTHPLVWGGGGYRELNTELTNAAQTGTVEGDALADMALKAAYGELSKGITVRVYARNFNVLRIQSGMGAIKYAN